MGDAPINLDKREFASGHNLESPPHTDNLQLAQNRLCVVIATPGFISHFAEVVVIPLRVQVEPPPISAPVKQPAPVSSQSSPATLHTDIIRLAQQIRRDHSLLFMSDPELKDRAARWFRSQLPPWGRRGGRGYDDVTAAIDLRDRFGRGFSRLYPDEKPHQIGKRVWKHICLHINPDYAAMNVQQQRDYRDLLRERVRDRLNKRKRSASLKNTSRNPPSGALNQSM